MRKAISITLQEENLLWLKGQAARTGRGSVSEILDQIVTTARAGGRIDPATVRSIAGTIDIPDSDPALNEADAYIRSMFAASTRQPVVVRERAPQSRTRRTRRG